MTTEQQNTITATIETQDSLTAIRLLGLKKKDPSFELDDQTELELRYVRMNSLSAEQLLNLMGESILAAYMIPDFDLYIRIKDYIDQLDNVGEEIKFTQGLLKVLDVSDEVLGNANISLKSSPVKATIGNWLEDYSSYPTGGRGKDALSEVEYMNKSPNVKLLSDSEKNVLKNIITIYDKAVQTIALYDSIEVPKSQKELYKDYDLYELIPGLEDDLLEESELKNKASRSQSSNSEVGDIDSAKKPELISKPISTQAEPLPRTVPSPSLNPPRQQEPVQSAQQTQEQTQAVPQSTGSKSSEPTAEQRRILEDINRAQHTAGTYNAVDSAKIHDLINHKSTDKRGVTMDPTNIKIDEEQQRINQARTKQEVEIQNKLAELRKRNKNSQ